MKLYRSPGDVGQVEVDVEESPFESEIEIEETPAETGPTREELLKQFETMKAEQDALRVKADQATQLSASFGSLGDRLEKVVNRPAPQAPAPVQQPGETAAQFKERLNRSYLEDPYEAIKEFSDRYFGGAVQTLAEQNANLQRKIALIEHPDREFVSKYKEEIMQELTNVPVDQQIRDPMAVNRVIDSVKARHLDDIVQLKVQEALSKAGLPASAPRPAPVGSSEVPLAGATPSQTSSSKKISITPRMKANIERQMAIEGIPSDKFKDYVGWLAEDGELDRYK